MTVLPRATPESCGVSSTGLQRFVEVHGFVLARHGKVIAEGAWAPYRASEPHELFSLSKSFVSTAIGFAVAEGLLSVDDQVAKFFPDDLPETLDDRLAALQVRHLLTMTTGHGSDALSVANALPGGSSWARGILGQRLEYEPGSTFVYNSGATYLLSAIISALSGESLVDYLTPRLFDPLGIEGATWASNGEGINYGGWGLSV
jgi:CubicO group peptidase (beta-lactamase class C family)